MEPSRGTINQHLESYSLMAKDGPRGYRGAHSSDYDLPGLGEIHHFTVGKTKENGGLMRLYEIYPLVMTHPVCY